MLLMLRSIDDLPAVIKAGVSLMFPGTFDEIINRRNVDTRPDVITSIPTADMSERDMFAVDCADLLVARDRSLAGRQLSFGLLDPSPVGPENWLMHRAIFVEAADVQAVVQAQDALLDLEGVDSDESDGLHEPAMVDSEPLNAIISDKVSIELHTPVGLGQ